MSPLETIIQAAQQKHSPLYEFPVIPTNHLRHLSRALADGDPESVIVDVPVSNVIGLDSTNPAHDRAIVATVTWYQALAAISGRGWTDDVFTYFEGDLSEAKFPVPWYRRPLELLAAGGAVGSLNGAKQLVAAYFWLLATKQDPVLRRCRVMTRKLEMNAVRQLYELTSYGTISVRPLAKGQDSLIRRLAELTGVDARAVFSVGAVARVPVLSVQKLTF